MCLSSRSVRLRSEKEVQGEGNLARRYGLSQWTYPVAVCSPELPPPSCIYLSYCRSQDISYLGGWTFNRPLFVEWLLSQPSESRKPKAKYTKIINLLRMVIAVIRCFNFVFWGQVSHPLQRSLWT